MTWEEIVVEIKKLADYTVRTGRAEVDIATLAVINTLYEYIEAGSVSVEAVQDTHDDLNCNANLQIGNADAANGNPVPVSDAGGALSVDIGGVVPGLDNTNEIKVSAYVKTAAAGDTALTLGQTAMAASVPVTIASDQSDIKVTLDSETVTIGSITAGDTNIGNVDIASLPSGNLGQKAMAASLSIVPASDITDATYVGDIKFGESLPAGTNLMGKVGIDQTTPGTTNGVYVNTVAAGGSVDIGALADAAVTDPTASASVIAALKGLLKQLQGTAAIVTKVNVEPSTLASTYSIKRVNITTASVNLAFGFTSKTIQIETGQSNDAEIAIDYLGGTAVAPAANTAGNDLVDAGRIITLDVATTSISVIAVSGTQTIYVRAWR